MLFCYKKDHLHKAVRIEPPNEGKTNEYCIFLKKDIQFNVFCIFENIIFEEVQTKNIFNDYSRKY